MEKKFDDRKLSSEGFYLYIGITSLCLYNTGGKGFLQDGILYKLNKIRLYKMQK